MPPPEAASVLHSVHACGDGRHQATPAVSSEDAPSTSSGGPQPRVERPKSARRQAAEALLRRRFSSSTLSALAESCSEGSPGPTSNARPVKRQRTDYQGSPQQPQQERPPVHVAACSDCTAGACSAAAPDLAWCAQDVALPPMDWPAVLQPVQGDAGMHFAEAGQAYTLPGGVRALAVSREEQLPAALGVLRDSMQDSCVAIDLEWKPEGWAGAGSATNRVALMQLASASVAVLVRVNQLGFRMPTPLRAFLSDPDLTFVGFSWDGADEGKMVQTFGAGRSLFARFVDLQQVGEALGYHGIGLGALTRQVLGVQPPKDRKVTMSNWEARTLSTKQVQYAALDAIITGHVYRGLRLWHASPSACTSCRQLLGTVLPKPEWRCLDCNRSFATRGALMGHKQTKRHRCSPGVCDECGRVKTAAQP